MRPAIPFLALLLTAPAAFGSGEAHVAEGALTLSCVGAHAVVPVFHPFLPRGADPNPVGEGCYVWDRHAFEPGGRYVGNFTWTAAIPEYEVLEACVVHMLSYVDEDGAEVARGVESSCVTGASPLSVALPVEVEGGYLHVTVMTAAAPGEVHVFTGAEQDVAYVLAHETA